MVLPTTEIIEPRLVSVQNNSHKITIQDQKMTVHDFFLHILKICKFYLIFFGTIDNVKRDLMSYR